MIEARRVSISPGGRPPVLERGENLLLDRREDHLRLGVVENDPDVSCDIGKPGIIRYIPAVDCDCSRLFPAVLVGEDAARGEAEGGLPRHRRGR